MNQVARVEEPIRPAPRAEPKRMGRPPSRSGVLVEAFRSAGFEVPEVRALIVKRLHEAADKGDTTALRILAERLLPPGRTLESVEALKEPAASGEERLARIGEAVTTGELALEEVPALVNLSNAISTAGEWRELGEAHRALLAGGVVNLPALPVAPEPMPEAHPNRIDISDLY